MRRYRTVEVEVDVEIDDVLEELDDDDLLAECERRGLSAGSASARDDDFLDDLARTLEIGRQMDATERRHAALRLREMMNADNRRSSDIADAYRKWQASRNGAPGH